MILIIQFKMFCVDSDVSPLIQCDEFFVIRSSAYVHLTETCAYIIHLTSGAWSKKVYLQMHVS